MSILVWANFARKVKKNGLFPVFLSGFSLNCVRGNEN
jgi:hypothetical protein